MPGHKIPPKADFEAFWENRFKEYALSRDDDAGIAGWSPTGLAARFRFFARHWPGADRGGFWLDVGCGAGTYSRYLAAQGQDVMGVDYSLPSLQKARARTMDKTYWVVADARYLPIDTGKASGILCFGVTQALEGTEALLEELARVTAPSGVVWVDGLNAWCLPHLLTQLKSRLRGRLPRVRYESPWRLRRLARAVGFNRVRLCWLPILPRRFSRLQGWMEQPVVVSALHWIPLLGALLSHSMVVIAYREGGDGAH